MAELPPASPPPPTPAPSRFGAKHWAEVSELYMCAAQNCPGRSLWKQECKCHGAIKQARQWQHDVIGPLVTADGEEVQQLV